MGKLVKKVLGGSCPAQIRVGDVVVTIVELGRREATISIAAPREVVISFPDGGKATDVVEPEVQSVLKDKD